VNCVATVEQREREREERRNGGACSGPIESRAQLRGFYSIPPGSATVGDHFRGDDRDSDMHVYGERKAC
jgi:hypothetical protein